MHTANNPDEFGEYFPVEAAPLIKVVDVRAEKANVYVGRTTPVGNPFVMKHEGMRDEVCDDFKVYLNTKLARNDRHIVKWFDNMVTRLNTGEYLILGCHCAPRRCHADQLKEVLIEMYFTQKFNSQKYTPIFRWSIHSGYEISSQGDKRFSALFAVMPDGRTLEMHYQLDVKAYDPGGTDWRLGKSKPPLNHMSREELYEAYLNLWKIWAGTNPELIEELRELATKHDMTLRDSFGHTNINQARALSQILSETHPSTKDLP